jgi:hypothetical protein
MSLKVMSPVFSVISIVVISKVVISKVVISFVVIILQKVYTKKNTLK